jgi:hypothetical protein
MDATERKPRGDAKNLRNYEEDLESWLIKEGITYAACVQRISEKYGDAVSIKQLHLWLRRRNERQLRETILRNVTAGAEATRQIKAQAQRHGVPDLDALISWVRVLIANLATRPDAEVDVDSLTAMLKPALEWAKLQRKDAELAMDRERLELLKRKAAQAETAEGIVRDTTLTPEEKMRRFRQTFGMESGPEIRTSGDGTDGTDRTDRTGYTDPNKATDNGVDQLGYPPVPAGWTQG